MSNKKFKDQYSAKELSKSSTNLNSKWYGEYGVSPINFIQHGKNSFGYAMFKGPPQQIPVTLFNDYIMGGKVSVRWWYCNEESDYSECNTYDRLPFVDPEDEDPFKIENLKEINFDRKEVDHLIKQIEDGTIRYYGKMARAISSAIEKFPIYEKSVCVMGSTHPAVEAYCIHYGANPTTIEYTEIKSNDERIKTITVKDYYDQKEGERNLFDAGISISSFEHDGLGKYGDPLDPWGDLRAMKRMKETIKKGGILYLSVPIGKDRLDWNAHRVYGKERLPLLLNGWKLLESYEMTDDVLNIVPFDPLEEKKGYGYQHCLFVLENV